MTFSATEAAFEGFRVVKRKPLTVVFWALAYLVFFVLFFALAGPSLVSVMTQMEALEGNNPSMADLEAVGQIYAGMIGVVLPLSLVLGAVLNAAVARAVVRPGESAFGYLRLGMDELRVLAVTFVLGLLAFVACFVLFGVVGVTAGIVGASGQDGLWLVVVLLGIAAFCALIWLMVRFSLAVPITVAEKRIAIFDSFGLTKGRFWPLLGMAIIAGIMMLLVSLLSVIISLPVTMMTGSLTNLSGLENLGPLGMLQAGAPVIISWVVLNSIFSALQLAVLYAPFSAAYRDIKGLAVE